MDSQSLIRKWSPILDHKDHPQIDNYYKKAVTAQLLENQERFLREQSLMNQSNGLLLTEAPTNHVGVDGYEGSAASEGPVAGFDPVLISLIRRTMPNLIAYDICGVQPMSGPTGLVFAMRALYNDQQGNEALFQEPNPAFSNTGINGNEAIDGAGPQFTNPGLLDSLFAAPPGSQGTQGFGAQGYDPLLGPNPGMGGMQKADLENLGDPLGAPFRQMAFSIEKAIVEAKGRALKAQYSMELAQDLRAIHGLDAEAELANILSSEILAEINREVIRTVYRTAVPGAQNNVVTPGVFDLDTDSNGRWSVEKFKGLLFQLERDCNAIAQQTRRGKGNMVICSADVASALTMAGVLDYTPALNANLNVDDTGNCFAGTINGKLKVYIDPYSANVSNTHYYVVGYKGANAYDAGLFYCPYVPLQMVRSVTAESFQPNIGFKTRYGLIANPFAEGSLQDNQGLGRLADNTNRYYRRAAIANLM
jgi:hypothetical protein